MERAIAGGMVLGGVGEGGRRGQQDGAERRWEARSAGKARLVGGGCGVGAAQLAGSWSGSGRRLAVARGTYGCRGGAFKGRVCLCSGLRHAGRVLDGRTG